MDINKMMQQAKKMQADIEKKRQELNKKEFTIEKQGIKLIILGNRNVVSLDINAALVDPEDKELLQDMLIIAFNEANELIDEEHEKIMPSTPGMPF